MSKIYSLKKAEITKNTHTIIHHVIEHWGDDQDYRYQSVRIGLVFPTLESPAYFVVGGLEEDPMLDPSLRGAVRIIEEVEVPGLSLDQLFNELTDSYISMLCDSVYMDFKANDEYRIKTSNYLSDHHLRVDLLDIPYKDTIMRFSLLRDFNDSGCLAIDKASALYQDLKMISKPSLGDNPESKFYRVNALSFLISGFDKFKPMKPLRSTPINPGGEYSWML